MIHTASTHITVHTVHTHSTYTQICSTHSTYKVHTVHTHSTYTQIRSTHSTYKVVYTKYTQYIHTVHTVHTHSTHTQNIHTAYSLYLSLAVFSRYFRESKSRGFQCLHLLLGSIGPFLPHLQKFVCDGGLVVHYSLQ